MAKKRLHLAEDELDRRRGLLREGHVQEQRQWRERRLRQVVLLLIERGEVEEGVPLAFKLPNHAEVLAKRKLMNVSDTQRARLEEMAADEDPRLDAAARVITMQTLRELLANGRPADAEPGPDVMQLLLDGQEVRLHQLRDEDENDDEFIVDPNAAAVPPAPPLRREAARSGSPSASRSGSGAFPLNGGGSDDIANANSSITSNINPSDDQDSFSPADAEEQRRLEHEDALIKELRHDRDHTRRRKTAEELYGPEETYTSNPRNVSIDVEKATAVTPHITRETSTTGIGRFLSPLTPWRGKKRQQQQKSAFDDREPEEGGGASRAHNQQA